MKIRTVIKKIDLSIKPSLERVGKLLKEARQSKNISSKELSEILRMGEEQIIAIENGQEDLLPEKVFIKGMIRRISEKLGVEKKIRKRRGFRRHFIKVSTSTFK